MRAPGCNRTRSSRACPELKLGVRTSAGEAWGWGDKTLYLRSSRYAAGRQSMRQEPEEKKLEKREKNRIAQRNHRKREAEKKRQYEKKIVELEAKMDRLAEAARRNDLADMISILQGDAESATAVVCRRPTVELGTPLYTAAAPLALPPPPPPPPAIATAAATTTELATLLPPNEATASPEPGGWLNIFEPVPELEPTMDFASSYLLEDEFAWFAPPEYGSDYLPAFSSYPSHPFQYQIPDGNMFNFNPATVDPYLSFSSFGEMPMLGL
ncbi:hypothetical protein EDB81DRAFT_806727 [Dactylonectria macrodidyma]|uniref:BZIP domain-containing protein n=1 Tax=Dactylonectria macrodidyma TaxID=307937 RepID=A0A9P9E8I0_9HYPO|nr:hypothetical protein EDB81DRAFT_833165 [Dactylonectria macrodidyma]KAH7132878.1 hypothetical protein EDB81DRAFT_806727 [Dactylonectria macrodidyma]